MVKVLFTQTGRAVTLVDNPSDLMEIDPHPVVAIFSAEHECDLATASDFVAVLVPKGCLEICCTGPLAELLHDHVDALLEQRGWLNVVTTADEDPSDAVEYFLLAANGAVGNLVAWINGDIALREALLLELAS